MKSGFIAVIGRPNVGKSTLINKIIGQKIAIMSDKPQTTRSRIQCILTQDDAQFIFLDTPGIHKPKFKLGEYMLKAAESTLQEVDVIFFVIDATDCLGKSGKRHGASKLIPSPLTLAPVKGESGKGRGASNLIPRPLTLDPVKGESGEGRGPSLLIPRPLTLNPKKSIGGGEKYILERLQSTKQPVILVINKIDLLNRAELLPIIATYSERYNFAATVPISAVDGSNVDELLIEAKNFLPEGPKYYPADMVTDQPERLIISEIIREKILHVTEDEVPHSVAVDIEEITSRRKDLTYIRATIYVERDSQKGILIGKGGELLKGVGQNARPEIEMLLGTKVFLDLWVKVKRDWRNSIGALQSFGLGEN